jgi:membrane-associated phospholipid phosphatase
VRASEWLVAAYFTYVALVATCFFPLRDPAILKSWLFALVICLIIFTLSKFPRQGHSYTRDLVPILYTLIAYREMNWFTPAVHKHRLEHVWIVWDRRILHAANLRGIIESTGAFLPGFLELCYALVYSVAAVSLLAIFLNHRRDRVNLFWFAYLIGTLGAYALFPYFPSEPPRTVFPDADLPRITTAIREFNLFIVGGYGIHSSVFPSAHVSSALSAAWGLLAAIPKRPWIGYSMAAYAFLVAIATIYGRYHYAVDGLAGIAVSLVALAALRWYMKPSRPPARLWYAVSAQKRYII